MKAKRETKTMKLAVMVTVAIMVTMALIGTGFAKYITEGVFADNARVAYWGIGVDESMDLFATSYGSTVLSSADDDVVAPGTDGDGTIVFTTDTGLPEVSYELVSDLTVVADGWNGTCPLVFTISDGTTTVSDINATDLADEMEDLLGSVTYNPGDAPSSITVEWEWPFSVDDVADTADGDNAAAGNAATITISGTVSAEQLD